MLVRFRPGAPASLPSSLRDARSLTSLRANGSRECAPDDRLREAIHATADGGMDCFVAVAPRNDGGEIGVRILATRMRPSLCHNMSLQKSEGAGNAGGALHPRSHTQMEKGAHEHTGSAEAPGIPCVAALRLMPRSPRRRIRLVTVVGGCKRHFDPVGSNLSPPTWHQQRVSGPHGFAVRSKRRSSCAPSRIAHEVQPALRPPCAPTLSRPPHPVPRS